MQILHLSCSPRGPAAESFKLSRKIIDFLLKSEPAATLINRVIADGAMPHIDANYALAQYSAAAGACQQGSLSRSDELIQELESADVVVIGTPMHNWTVPSALKAWIDHVVRARRTFSSALNGKVGMLHDRPVFIAVASGAIFRGERAQQPDFLTPYLKFVLGTIGLRDLTFFCVEGAGTGPEAMTKARTEADQALQEYFSSFPGVGKRFIAATRESPRGY